MATLDTVAQRLRQLRLSGMRAAIAARVEQARASGLRRAERGANLLLPGRGAPLVHDTAERLSAWAASISASRA